ncbi:serine/threonine kinase [Aureococcus anophagefferens]|nr:serine/threonine kinase [Aureococcus anophagefferens]
MGAGASAAPAAFHAHFADVPDDDAMLEKYDIDISDANLLGEGQFGRCYRCALRDDPSQKFAVKVVPMPENLILASKDDDTTIHLVDFGLAAHVDDERAMKSQCGTPQFLAPEIVEGNPPYGPKTDCWAVGVIAYNLLHGLPPFNPYNDMDQGALFDDIRRNNWKFDPVTFDHVSDEAKDLIAKLMTKDVESRLTAEQALLHPWFQMGEHALVVKHLDETYQNLKTWNARRKLRQPSTHLVGSGGVTPDTTPAATPANSPPAVARELEASSSAPQLEDRS